MKKTLLFFALSLGLNAVAQQPIQEFQGVLPAESSENYFDFRMYQRGTFEVAPDETATGVNANWDFSDVSFQLIEQYTNTLPTDAQLLEFPESNFVTTAYDYASGTEAGTMFAHKSTDGTFVILGNNGDLFSLHFSGDGASIGQFPMNYATTSNDIVSGTFDYNGPEGTFSGNFQGTIVSTYDAYGNFTAFNDDATETTYASNRLHVVMDLTFGTAEIPTAGTITQTSNFYYLDNELWPKIRSVRNQISVPLLSIDQDETVLEKSFDVMLASPEFETAAILVYPNPTQNILSVSSQNQIKSISIFSVDGKQISSTTGNQINVQQLSSGLYVAKIDTGSGIVAKKFVKN